MPDSPSIPQPSPAERDVLGERVHCDDVIGFQWQAQDALPPAAVLARMNARNEAVLRALAMLEEHDETTADDNERAEFHRLEGKMNLVLELLTELVRQHQPGPPQLAVRISAEGVCWPVDGRIEPGALVLTEWYLLPAWPVALNLLARVEHCAATESGLVACARLEGAGDGTRDWLEKLVFRRHRRAIAQQRTTRAGETETGG